MASSLKNPNSVLLIANQQIGDVLLSTTILHDMRLAWPNATIDVLVFQNTAGILEGNPDCNDVIEVAHRPNKAGYWQLFKRIFRRYDLAITTQGNDRAHQYALLAAPIRMGLIPDNTRRNLWKRIFNTSWVMLDETDKHTVVQNSLLSGCLGIKKHHKVIPPSSSLAELQITKMLNFDWQNSSYVVIHPFPMWQYKRWTDKGWHDLIAYLTKQNKHIVITGGPREDEQNYCRSLADAFPGQAISIAGKTSFAEMVALLNKAQAYIGPDTVSTHLAAACGTPTLALFGPTNPVKWGPWPIDCNADLSPWKNISPIQQLGNVILLQGTGDCVPCHKAGCDNHNNSQSRCLNELGANRVIAAVETLLKKNDAYSFS